MNAKTGITASSINELSGGNNHTPHRRTPKSLSVDMQDIFRRELLEKAKVHHEIKWKNALENNRLKSLHNKNKTTQEEFKGQTDMHALHQAYKNRRVQTHETHSTFNSTTSGSGAKYSFVHRPNEFGSKIHALPLDYLLTQQSDDNDPMNKYRHIHTEENRSSFIDLLDPQKPTSKNAIQPELLEADMIIAEEKRSRLEKRPTPVNYPSLQKPRFRNCFNIRIPPIFRKLRVVKPDFFCLPRKLLNDDMPPFPDEESIEYEYLDVGSFAEPKEVIQEVDEEDESPMLNKTSKRHFESFVNEECKQETKLFEPGSMIINAGEFGTFQPRCNFQSEGTEGDE